MGGSRRGGSSFSVFLKKKEMRIDIVNRKKRARGLDSSKHTYGQITNEKRALI